MVFQIWRRFRLVVRIRGKTSVEFHVVQTNRQDAVRTFNRRPATFQEVVRVVVAIRHVERIRRFPDTAMLAIRQDDA